VRFGTLPAGIRENREAVQETIENNVRRLIIDEQPINPKYYDRMSQLLDALIAQRRQEALSYQQYLERIVTLTKQVVDPYAGASYPRSLDTPAKRALFDNLGKNEALALAVDAAIRAGKKEDWRSGKLKVKVKEVKLAIKAVLAARKDEARAALADAQVMEKEWPAYGTNSDEVIDPLADLLLELAKNQHEY
jgi:type I restriction enzyme, R subunit